MPMSKPRFCCAVLLFELSIFSAWLCGSAMLAQQRDDRQEMEHRVTALEAVVPTIAADVKELKGYQLYILASLAALTGKGAVDVVTARKRKSGE